MRVRMFGMGVFNFIFNGGGLSAIGSNLPKASYFTPSGSIYGGPIPTKEPTVAFSFDCRALDEGKYVVAVQWANIPKNADHFVVLKHSRGVYVRSPIQIQVSKSTGPTIDIGEVILFLDPVRQ